VEKSAVESVKYASESYPAMNQFHCTRHQHRCRSEAPGPSATELWIAHRRLTTKIASVTSLMGFDFTTEHAAPVSIQKALLFESTLPASDGKD
jgi:hypothetical protein